MKLVGRLVLGILLCGSAAVAQRVPVPERSEPFAKKGERAGPKDTRQTVQEFARCVTRREVWRTGKYLEEGAIKLPAFLKERASECLGDAAGDGSVLSGQGTSFRYAFAEAFLVRKYREEGIGDLSTIAPLELPAGPNAGLNALAECVIRRNPADSWALLRTDATSPEEKASLQRLAPAMQACVPQGTTLKMQAFFMRGAIAETYYLLSKAPGVVPSVNREGAE